MNWMISDVRSCIKPINPMNKNRKTLLLLLTAVVFFIKTAPAVELGVIGGPMTNPQSFAYGFSVGSGMILPILKIEFEGFRVINETDNILTAGIKLRPKLGKIAPYGIIGAGVRFQRLNFDFNAYRFFTFFGGGLHFYVADMLSLRLDIRWLDHGEDNRFRFSVGLFLHL